MKQSETKLAFGVSLSEWDKNSNPKFDFRFDCMDNMKESFCMLRIGVVECDSGKFWKDKCFEEYAKICNKLSIPWVGYIYFHLCDKIVLPSSDVWNIFDGFQFSLPYITFIFNVDIPNLDINRLNSTIQFLEKVISTKSNKPLTVCCGVVGHHRELADHSEFKYPLYVEMLLLDNCSSFSVSMNTILCWYDDSRSFYSIDGVATTIEDKIIINRVHTSAAKVIALGELADAIHNYRSS